MINIMSYLFWIVLLIIVSFFIVYISKLKEIRERYGDLLTYVVGIIMLMSGIIAPIYLNRKIEIYEEKQTAIKMLNRATEDIEFVLNHISYLNTVMSDTSSNTYTHTEYFKRNPVIAPSIIYAVLDNENVLMMKYWNL